MIAIQNSTRLLNSVLSEQPGSTASKKILSIYGVKNIFQLLNVPIEVKCSTGASSGLVSIIVNDFDTKSLKIVQNSTKTNPTSQWVELGSTYRIMYDGTDFILLSNVSNSSGSSSNNTSIPEGITSLTSSSTSSDITLAFSSDGASTAEGKANILAFMNAIQTSTPIVLVKDTTASSDSTTQLLNRFVTTTSTTIHKTSVGAFDYAEDTIELVLPDSKVIKRFAFKRSTENAEVYASVTVTDIKMGGDESASITSDGTIKKIIRISQSDYDALTSKESTTLYIIS